MLIATASVGVFEFTTHIGRGRLFGDPFYEGRPVSYWADEIERWESQNASWETKTYERRPIWPRWFDRMLPAPTWPRLLDGDPAGLPVLEALRKHPSNEVQDWARIGIERIDNDERGPYKIKHPSVIVTAQLYEVDEAFYKEVAKAGWLSMADLEKMGRIFVDGSETNQAAESLFDLLGKQKLLLSVKDIKIEAGKEESLLASTKSINGLPSPAQLRKGQKGPQKIDIGVTLRASVQVSAERRLVRVRFIEKGSELEGIDKVPLVLDQKGAPLLDEKGAEAVAEIACVKESTLSVLRSVPDGGSLLLPMQYRPRTTKEKGRWLVAMIELRIRIEAEERRLRGEADK